MKIEKKVTASAVSAAAVTVLVFLAAQFGVEVPETVAAAAVTLVAAAAAYLAPHTPRPVPPGEDPGGNGGNEGNDGGGLFP